MFHDLAERRVKGEPSAGAAMRRPALGPGSATSLGPTLAAALASALAATALHAVLQGGTWYAQALGAVAIVAGVGVVGRAFRAPASVVFAGQILGVVGYLTAVYAPGPATFGVAPLRRAAWTYLADSADLGLTQLVGTRPPVDVTPQMALVVVAGIALMALLVDALAVGCGRPAPAGLPLLVAYLIPAGILPDGLSPWYFVLPAAGYLLLLLVVGHAPPAGGEAPGDVRRGPGLTASSQGIFLGVLALAVAVPALAPELSVDALGAGRNAGGTTISTLNPMASLRRDLVRQDDFPVLTLRTDSTRPQELYLRTVTLEDFDGERWTSGSRSVRRFDADLPGTPDVPDSLPATPVETTISVTDQLGSDYLPMPFPATRVDVDGSWRVDEDTGNVVSAKGRSQIAGLNYTVHSLEPHPTPAEYAADDSLSPDLDRYLALPTGGLHPAVRRLAQDVTADAGDPLARALALQAWFRGPGNFTYDLTAVPGSGGPAILEFLRDRRGYCEQFASTMAAMARYLGIPARVNVGFTSGSPNADGSRTVSARDAHAWPELYLAGLGWTRFEPTPGSASSRPTVPDWLAPLGPDEDSSTAPDPGTAGAPEPVPPAQPPAGAPATPECTGADAGSAKCQAAAGPAPPSAAGSGGRLSLALLVLLGGAAVVTAPAAWRFATRRRRWVRAAARAQVAEAAWRELRDDAVDLGYAWPSSRTPRQTADSLASGAGLSPAGVEALVTITRTVERSRYAPPADPAAGDTGAETLRGALILVRQDLAAAAGRSARLRARLLPASLFRPRR